MIFASKYHGYGNDFIVVSADQLLEAEYSTLAKAICDPHFGVGADGCVFVERAKSGIFPIRIFNKDGSESGMSGNGARCAAAFIHHRRLTPEKDISFMTPSGAKRYQQITASDFRWTYRSSMGLPRFEPAAIPFNSVGEVESAQGLQIELAEGPEMIWAVNVGNPQCGVFLDNEPSDSEFMRLGSQLSVHERFPEGTNVSLILVEDSHHIRIRIWERGVGPTFSSGTGSCGAAVLAIRSGLASSPVEVTTATGTQTVEWSQGQQIYLQGEAEFIADIHFRWN